MRRNSWLALALTAGFVLPALSIGFLQARVDKEPRLKERNVSPERRARACALLDDARFRAGISSGFELRLLLDCGRLPSGRLDVTSPSIGPPTPDSFSADKLMNNPAGDTGSLATTQSEVSLAVRSSDGRLCSGWNDSWHFDQDQHDSFSGFGYSTDGGSTWTDGGRVPPLSGEWNLGDPDVDYRGADNRFYYLSLDTSGIAIHSSLDCTSFPNHKRVVVAPDADKPMMTIDSTGRLFVVYTDFAVGKIFLTHASNPLGNGNGTWSFPASISNGNDHGAWPTPGPDGIYVIWMDRSVWPNLVSYEIARITLQPQVGNQFTVVVTPRTSPLVNAVVPSDPVASDATHCNRPALNGFVRHSPFPQLTYFGSALHVIYARDPDGYQTGDTSNIYYRRSTNGAVSWGPEVLLNDDGGT
ncbi:MAG TPA: hypothetical protein VFU03_02345, partial [Gemmatimonadales bacterium]|nr:hypothetical protein [Gemmatimonadales bacterium]